MPKCQYRTKTAFYSNFRPKELRATLYKDYIGVRTINDTSVFCCHVYAADSIRAMEDPCYGPAAKKRKLAPKDPEPAEDLSIWPYVSRPMLFVPQESVVKMRRELLESMHASLVRKSKEQPAEIGEMDQKLINTVPLTDVELEDTDKFEDRYTELYLALLDLDVTFCDLCFRVFDEDGQGKKCTRCKFDTPHYCGKCVKDNKSLLPAALNANQKSSLLCSTCFHELQ